MPGPHRENWRAGRPADKAREGGAPTGRTGPGVFRPKRNDERNEVPVLPAGGRFSRGASPAEPPPGELGRATLSTGCSCRVVRSGVIWGGYGPGSRPRARSVGGHPARRKEKTARTPTSSGWEWVRLLYVGYSRLPSLLRVRPVPGFAQPSFLGGNLSTLAVGRPGGPDSARTANA